MCAGSPDVRYNSIYNWYPDFAVRL